jgi:hypothetical protein
VRADRCSSHRFKYRSLTGFMIPSTVIAVYGLVVSVLIAGSSETGHLAKNWIWKRHPDSSYVLQFLRPSDIPSSEDSCTLVPVSVGFPVSRFLPFCVCGDVWKRIILAACGLTGCAAGWAIGIVGDAVSPLCFRCVLLRMDRC